MISQGQANSPGSPKTGRFSLSPSFFDLSVRPGKRFAGAKLRIGGETRGTGDAVLLQIPKPAVRR